MYSILVNTCDKFEDCWDPFFKLFSKYWPDYKGKIYLNTEYKDYSFKGLNIIALKVCEGISDTKRLTWSECLKIALSKINEETILYLQEDYFFKDFVKDEIVNSFAGLINLNSDIDCIHLTDQAVIPDAPSDKYHKLWRVAYKQRYRISCQAALWRKSILSGYLLEHESAWQFEEFGSKRGAIFKHNFYVVDSKWIQLNKFEIIPYIFTGIVQGRWFEEVVPLFQSNEISIDYNIRGYVKNAPKRSLSTKLKNRINKFPNSFRSYLNLALLKFKFSIT